MYSLYRAWLMRDAVAAATLATPPDVVVNVGGGGAAGTGGASRQFAAHRAVLASHSGYLKALLAAAAAGVGSAVSGGAAGSASQASSGAISVPNVSPEAFAPLLSFMYTGYLDVTHENIYGVLLATHLLHMPRALDLCRAFLLQHQHQPPPAPPPPPPPPPQRPSPSTLPALVKPIPSRKMLPMLLGLGGLPPPPPPGPFWPPPPAPPYQTLPVPHPPPPPHHAQLLLPTSDPSPFRCLLPTPTPADDVPSEEATRPRPASLSPARRSQSPLAGPSNSSPGRKSAQRSPSPPSSVSPCLSGTSFSSDERHVVSMSPVPAPLPKTKKTPSLKSSGSSRKMQNSHDDGSASASSKVIIDVACCDGPVRFHRVLNDNYGLALDDILVTETTEAPIPEKGEERQEKCMDSEEHNDSRTDGNSSDQSTSGSREKVSSTGGSSDTVYTCLYCNHTFKSHYCYQKHARRHINPVTLDLARLADKLGVAAKATSSGSKSSDKDVKEKNGAATSSTSVGVRREVRLLDMNVQYYPCKTCGSKFPSYYFVHKHRKLCHANEDSSVESVVVSSNDDSHHSQATAAAASG